MKTIRVALCIATLMMVHGAESRGEPLFSSVSGAFAALSVADMKASVKWYSEKLGLKVVMEVPKRDRVAVTVLEGGGLVVELMQHDDALPLNKAAASVKDRQLLHGMYKFGVVVQDFDRTLAQLKARGAEVAYGPYPASEKQKANVLIRDNSGNLIQFFGQ